MSLARFSLRHPWTVLVAVTAVGFGGLWLGSYLQQKPRTIHIQESESLYRIKTPKGKHLFTIEQKKGTLQIEVEGTK